MPAAETRQLDDVPVTMLKGVGPKLAQRLLNLGIESVQDVLFHLPTRYQDRTRVSPIGSLRPGDEAVIVAEVELSQIKFGRRRSLLCHVSDGTGALTIRLFHFSAAQQASLAKGARLRCFGEVRRGPASLEMVHPEYERLAGESDSIQVDEQLTPIYPTTEGLHQLSLRRISDHALLLLDNHCSKDLLPASAHQTLDLPDLDTALRLVHRPPPDIDLNALREGLHPAQQRLAFEELLAHHLSLRIQRDQNRQWQAPRLDGGSDLEQRLIDSLAFSLTRAQQRVGDEIRQDLSRTWPMQRLVQGDVGSGKTVVAAIAALHAIGAGYQVALMAPTEILAEQHYRSFQQWFLALDIPVIWLAGKLPARARREHLGLLATRAPLLAVGTHALFQDEVDFGRLGLVIIDEQHRFGVHQRMALREKGQQQKQRPHQLIMTATPIPRTLAMTAYADLDTSIIDELPPGRQPVETVALPDARRDEVVERIRNACGEGRQAYWVCTLIDESEAVQAQAASDTAEALAEALPGLHVGLVHGRMKPAEKEHTMGQFKAGKIDLLVATTVIEVGVDVPRASLMVIENTERLGLSQLHQLRGRVGRGHEKSNCLLLYRSPLSRLARARLGVMRETSDGFAIAQRDLELRGPGELLGTRQTGLPQLRIADLVRDRRLFTHLETVAEELRTRHPQRIAALLRRWIGDGVQYRDI